MFGVEGNKAVFERLTCYSVAFAVTRDGGIIIGR